MGVRDCMNEAAATHGAVRVVPTRDPASVYRMLVPRSWSAASRLGGLRFELGRPEPIGFYVESEATNAAAVVVTQSRLPAQLRLEDYVRGQCAHEGWRVQHTEWIDVEGDARFVALASKGRSMRRVVANVDHARLFQHSSTASVEAWARLEQELWCSAVSFELLLPTRRRLFEGIVPCSAFGREALLPESWTCEVKRQTAGVAAWDANLDVHGWRAFVRVEARKLDAPTPDTGRLAVAEREIREGGMVPAVRKARVVWRPDVEARVYASSVNLFGELGEAWYGLAERDGVEWTVLGISRAVETDGQGCLRMRGAVELALMTL